MVRDYELMYIVRPELDDEGLQAATASVEALVNGVGGSVVRSTSWGRRRLAYEVNHLRDGHYMLLDLRLDGARVAEVERALTIHDTVFRHLLVLHEAGAEVAAEAGAADSGAPAAAVPAGAEAAEPERQTAVAPTADDEPDDDADEDDEDAVAAEPEEEI